MADELQKWKEQNPTKMGRDFPKGIFKPMTDYSNFDTIDDDDDDDDGWLCIVVSKIVEYITYY